MPRLLIYICLLVLVCVIVGQGVESLRDFSIPMAINNDAPPSDLSQPLLQNSFVPGTPAGKKLDLDLNGKGLSPQQPQQSEFDTPVFRDGELDSEEPTNFGFDDFEFVSDEEATPSIDKAESDEAAAETAVEAPSGRSSDANTATQRYSQLINADDQELVKLLLCDSELVSLIDLLMAALNARRSSQVASVDVCQAHDAVQRVQTQLLHAKWSAEVALLQRVQAAIEQVQNEKDE